MIRPKIRAVYENFKRRLRTPNRKEPPVTPEAATSAYVIVIRDHINSDMDRAMIREVIGPFFEESDAQEELDRMLNGNARRLNGNYSDLYWTASQGLTTNDSFSFSIHETILPMNSRWNGSIVPWTGFEPAPYFGHIDS